MFEMAVGTHQRLVVIAGADELRTALDSPAEMVVIDAPEPARLDAWERARTQHDGMVLVAVDSQAETKDWPPDLGRRFLVRPLHAEEVVAALAVRPKILREPTAARRRRLAQAYRPPVVPLPDQAADQPPPEHVERVRRLSSEESLWEGPGGKAGAADPAPGPAAAARPRALSPGPARHRSWMTAAAMLLLLVATGAGGIAIGRATASPDHKGPQTATPAASTPGSSASTAAPGVVIKEKTPEACDAALSDADAAISYLVGNVRDQRLSQSMQRYQENRRTCREASR
jgi:hypothetical protein